MVFLSGKTAENLIKSLFQSVPINTCMIGIVAGSPVDNSFEVSITARITDDVGILIGETYMRHNFTDPVVLVPFDQPYRLTAGKTYIASTRVYILPRNYPPLVTFVGGINSTQCGGITVTFANVSQAEMDDSNLFCFVLTTFAPKCKDDMRTGH